MAKKTSGRKLPEFDMGTGLQIEEPREVPETPAEPGMTPAERAMEEIRKEYGELPRFSTEFLLRSILIELVRARTGI